MDGSEGKDEFIREKVPYALSVIYPGFTLVAHLAASKEHGTTLPKLEEWGSLLCCDIEHKE